jgi:SAM-dependent methyltransferase
MEWFYRTLYRLRSRWEDRRIGGISLEAIKPSKFKALGAEATQSSDYRCLDRIRKQLALSPSDVLMDVGCGEGRVLTYFYLHRCKGKLLGVELDPDVAETARQRVAGCNGIEILSGNVLDHPEWLEPVTVFYLFNPFNGKIFSKFIAALEKTVTHPIRLVYLFDYYGGYLTDRPGWETLADETMQRRGGEEAHYSIHRYTPQSY